MILDLDTTNNSSFEVLKYLRLNASFVNVVLTVKDESRLKELELNRDDLKKLGAGDVLIKPFSLEMLLESIEGANQFESWKDIKSVDSQGGADEEVLANDDEFTRIRIRDFHSRNTNIFDCYIRLSENKYVKILHKGDFFDESRVKKYTKNQTVEFLYFMTKERAIYINFINSVLDKMVSSAAIDVKIKVNTAKSLTEKYIEEVYVSGLKPQLIEEGKQICENIYNLIKKDTGLTDLMRTYEEYDPPAFAHLFLVSFFSAITCQNLDWSSQRTVEIIAFGALLHDIGKLKLPIEYRELRRSKMSIEQIEVYKTHPRLGAEMLQQYPLVSEPVRQIVFQHHEHITGEGFPNGLTGSKIYPLAKIVSFADEFASLIMERKITPVEGLQILLTDRQRILQFDSEVVKALIKGFVRKKK